MFSGTLAVGGTRFYSFTAAQAGVTTLMLASLTRDGSGAALSTGVGLGLGVPSGPDCATTASVVTGPALTPEIAETVLPGIYCVRITDSARSPSRGVRHPHGRSMTGIEHRFAVRVLVFLAVMGAACNQTGRPRRRRRLRRRRFR